jgi:hypothetical protein
MLCKYVNACTEVVYVYCWSLLVVYLKHECSIIDINVTIQTVLESQELKHKI